MSDIWFKMMAVEFKVRDYLHPREEIVKEIGLKEGFQVLDYGCGPGGYVPAVSDAVGSSGKVYALDALSAAIEMVNKKAAQNGLKNVSTMLSNCAIDLADEVLDVVLLYDVFHDLENQNAVLNELYRVLKPAGLLSFRDHHLKENEIISKITGAELFRLQRKNGNTSALSKQSSHNLLDKSRKIEDV